VGKVGPRGAGRFCQIAIIPRLYQPATPSAGNHILSIVLGRELRRKEVRGHSWQIGIHHPQANRRTRW
jgi:hypothetical protein